MTYEALRLYLLNQQASELTLSLAEIERIIGCPLLPAVRVRPQYWEAAAKRLHRAQPYRAVRDAGYSAVLTVSRQQVRFVRD